jgi:transcriptional regulator with XRE-family HTH domain
MRKAQVPSHGGTSGATLGETIAAYRLSQSPNGKQWSQEELAFACGTHQAHLSLIENNQKHPQLWTLVRICDALGLRQDDRSKLLALAGYHVAPPLPDEAAARSVLSKLVPILESYPYPTILMDEGEVTWHYNSIGTVIFGPLYGFNDLERFRSSTRGTRTFELLFDPDLFSRWKLYFEDLDNILMRVVLSVPPRLLHAPARP